MTTPHIPKYELRENGSFFGKHFNFYIVDVSDPTYKNGRFVGGSGTEEEVKEYFRLLTKGNWYD